jgi:threonine synthase
VVLEFEGTVTAVDDTAIMQAKASVDGVGIGCEPASAAGLAGIRRLVSEGVIQPGERVLTYLTGHLLKDGDANAAQYLEGGAGDSRLIVIDPTTNALDRAMERLHAAI